MSDRANDSAPCMRYDATPCAIAAYGVAKVPFGEIHGLRKTLGPAAGRKIAPSLMKHADQQTVLALAGILKAIDDFGWRERTFERWGIIAAPRFLGRVIGAMAMDRFGTTRAPGVSPLIIPTLSLHAVAGSLSLAMKTHGFNYGVGGGHGHVAEALMTGLAARDDDDVPGLWVVATQFHPEAVPDTNGGCRNEAFGYAVALAVVATGAARSRLNLRLVATAAAGPPPEPVVDGVEPASGLVALAEFLTEKPKTPKSRRWYCPLPGGGAIELDDDPARASGAVDDLGKAARAG